MEETNNQKKRLKEICNELDIKPTHETCKAMKGIIEEAKSFMEYAETDDVMDAGLIAEAQRMEH